MPQAFLRTEQRFCLRALDFNHLRGVHVLQVSPVQHFTKPPPRFTEASMVKALEEAGVGRPSTYAPTIRLLQVSLSPRRCAVSAPAVLPCTLVSKHCSFFDE
jgi:hypothetical protein